MDGPISDIWGVLRQLEDDLGTVSESDQTPLTYISNEEDDGDEEEEKQEDESIATWFRINCDGLKDFDLSLIQVTIHASNSLHEIGYRDEVETEVNTVDDGQMVLIDGGDDVINGVYDEALHIQVVGEAADS